MQKIILWGYPLYSHTHSFLHYGYEKAFKSLGYEVYWTTNPNSTDFNNSIIITEGYATQNLPIVKSSTYIVHVLGNKTGFANKFLNKVKRLIDMRYLCKFWKDKNYDYVMDKNKLTKISDSTYFEKGSPYDILYTVWATDLLPHEFNFEDRFIEREKKFFYVGTIGGGLGGINDCQKAPDEYDNVPHIMPFIRACQENNIEIVTSCPWKTPKTNEENRELIRKSYLAPDFRHNAMLAWGYVPCRIFKNISYGQLGMTNSEAIYEFFNKMLIYNKDGYQLFYDGQNQKNNFDLIKEQMYYVQQNHTYLNRVKDILAVINNG